MTIGRTMNIADLLGVFHSALVALIPCVERVGMPWRDGESYDDWDSIVESLWKALVVGSISDAFPQSAALDLPRYGFGYGVYAFRDLLIVSGSTSVLSIVQQVVLDGSPVPRIKVARTRLVDRVCIGNEEMLLENLEISLVRFCADGSQERTVEITLP